MEFEEMKKIWDAQNNVTLYVLNEDALHNNVKKKKKKANRTVGINEIGLIAINLIVGSVQFYEGFVKGHNLWDYLMGAFMFGVAGFIFYLRTKRRSNEVTFDRSIVGELDHAIHNTKSVIYIGSTMVWWYMAPVLVMTLSRFAVNGVEWYYYALIVVIIALATLLTRWEVRKMHTPRMQRLVSLRAKLLEEVD